MNKPSILAMATVLAVSAGLVNAASQIAPKGATSSVSGSVGIVAQGDSQSELQSPEATGSEQANANEPADDPQDIDQSAADTAPEASGTASK